MRNLTLILCTLALTGAIASGVMFFVIGNTKQELHHRWENTLAEKAAIEARLAAAEENNAELISRIRNLDTDLAAHKRELTDLKLDADQLRQTLTLVEEERASALAASEELTAQLSAQKADLAQA